MRGSGSAGEYRSSFSRTSFSGRVVVAPQAVVDESASVPA